MLADLGLITDRQGYISLDVKKDSDTIIDCDDLKPIYELTPRRTLEQYPIDPALKSLLNNDGFEYYNGKAQRDAVSLGPLLSLICPLVPAKHWLCRGFV
jgi:hypothetical protein